jgi:hypothetical protein
MKTLAATLFGAALVPVSAIAAPLDREPFRYERTLPQAAFTGRAAVEPDGLMLAHAKPGLTDLRIVDARGEQVPWRRLATEHVTAHPGLVLNAGREGRAAVALIDLGRPRRYYERIELDIPGREFVGRVTVLGADRRRGPWTRLSVTRIFDLTGAKRARSTTAVVPPSDFRFLRLRAEGVRTIRSASVYQWFQRPRLVRRRHAVRTSHNAAESVLLLDFGVGGIPVSKLELREERRSYDRPVRVEASTDGSVYRLVGTGRIRRAPGELSASVPLDVRARYLRVRVENGDDPPLRYLRSEAYGPSFAFVVEPEHPTPLVALYGAPAMGPPSYEFARLPGERPAAILDPSQLPPERLNPLFEPPVDTRSFFERHDWLVQLAIAFAALGVGAAGLLALRRRT